jgi:hypothetical protein
MFPKGTDKVGQKVKPHNRFIAVYESKKYLENQMVGYLRK